MPGRCRAVPILAGLSGCRLRVPQHMPDVFAHQPMADRDRLADGGLHVGRAAHGADLAGGEHGGTAYQCPLAIRDIPYCSGSRAGAILRGADTSAGRTMRAVMQSGMIWTLSRDGRTIVAEVREIEGIGLELRYMRDREPGFVWMRFRNGIELLKEAAMNGSSW